MSDCAAEKRPPRTDQKPMASDLDYKGYLKLD